MVVVEGRAEVGEGGGCGCGGVEERVEDTGGETGE